MRMVASERPESKCARRDPCVHQRMNANGFFYYHIIYSPETNNQSEIQDYIHTIVATIYMQNNSR